jgi:peroxiredoxin Q/BCP
MKRFVLSLAALGALALALPCFAADRPAVGDDAPDVTFQGSDGKTYKLSDFEGKSAVVLAWFPKAFTGGCTKECQALKDQGEALRKYDVAYFTASVDPVEENKKFAESLKLDYPILSDPSREAATAFGVLNERNMASRVTFVIGEDGKILAVDDKVNVQSHGTDLAAKLKEVGVAEKK